MKHMIRFACLLVSALVLARPGEALDFSTLEDFALNDRREEALKRLVPGTDDYYYYHCLHHQLEGNRAEFQKALNAWVKKRKGNWNGRMREMRRRQALLDFETTPDDTWKFLTSVDQHLAFNHRPEAQKGTRKYPQTLNASQIALDIWLNRAKRHNHPIAEFTDSGLGLALQQSWDDQQLRSLLGRLQRADYTGLVDFIVRDLKARDSRGFGHHQVHRLLSKEQLWELGEKLPTVFGSGQYINECLSRLQPGEEVDFKNDRDAAIAHYVALWEFVQKLDPVHNSTKAQVLYNLLDQERRTGVYDQEKFLRYLEFPRRVHYLPVERRRDLDRRKAHWVNFGNQLPTPVIVPPIGNEEPLVRDFLIELLKDAENPGLFREQFEQSWLEAVFAESKILHGVGKPEDWGALLSASRFRAIQERIELNFSLTNAQAIRPGDNVALEVEVKNVPSVLVKVFEIQTFNYYKRFRSPVDQAVDLDGMVATHEFTLDTKADVERRVTHTIDLPQIRERGVYVVELIGNGISSRALLQVGKLELISRPTAFGQAVVVLDETGNLVEEARIWMAGTEYKATKDGLILLPFSNAPKDEFVILRSGEFSSPERIHHLGEQYSFTAGIYVEPQATRRQSMGTLVLRPDLRVNGVPVSPAMLEHVVVKLRSLDVQGTPVEREYPAKFVQDEEWVQEFFVPDSLRQLQVSVSAKLRQKRDQQMVKVGDSASFLFNTGRGGMNLREFHLVPTRKGWFGELRGVNGEPIPDVPVDVTVWHPYFNDDLDFDLTTDERGRLGLTGLQGISRIRLTGASAVPITETVAGGYARLPPIMHVPVGKTVELPHPHEPRPGGLPEASLMQLRRGRILRYANEHVAVENGMLSISGLTAGDYRLRIHATGQELTLQVSDGEDRMGYAIGKLRRLQLGARKLPTVVKTEVKDDQLHLRVANADSTTRITAIARRMCAYPAGHPGRGQGFAGLSARKVRYPYAQYVSGRNIGDEYRYVLDRRNARKFAGTLLDRPGLILNPWMLRETVAEMETLFKGEKYQRSRQEINAPASVPAPGLVTGEPLGFGSGRGADADYAGVSPAVARELRKAETQWSGQKRILAPFGYDYLPQGAQIANNVFPDKEGRAVVPLKGLAEQTFVDVYVTDRFGQSKVRVLLADKILKPRDQRLASGLDPATSYSRQKSVRVMKAGDEVLFGDSATARVQGIRTVGEAFDLLHTLNGDPRLADFAFVRDWPSLENEEKKKKLSEYACHELHLFLYFKDRPFFDEVVKPYLENKKDQTFVDRWLLGDPLDDLVRVDQLGKRNALELWLWGIRRGQEKVVQATFDEFWEMQPPNPSQRDRLIRAALSLKGLEEETGLFLDGTSGEATPMGAVAFGTVSSDRRGRRNEVASMRGTVVSKAKLDLGMAVDAPMEAEEEIEFFEEEVLEDALRADVDKLSVLAGEAFADREAGKRLYRPLPKTKEWAEQNYYQLRNTEDTADRIGPSAFWRSLAHGSTLSAELLEAHRNLTEVLVALAVTDLPFEAEGVDEKREGGRLTVRASGPTLLVAEEILPAEMSEDDRPLLMSQQFYRSDDRYRYEQNEQIEKFVDGEFIRRVVYGGRVTLTNPTSSRRRLNVLLQIPVGALPIANGFYTDDRNLVLEPYTTQKLDYLFYFPEAGDFGQFPVHASAEEKIVGKAEPQTFHVVPKPTTVDKTSWLWISQNGSKDDVLDYLRNNNLRRLKLDLMAWRLKDKDFYEQAVSVLEDHLLYHEPSYRYGFFHKDVKRAQVWLQNSSYPDKVGRALDSVLLTVDPVERKNYQHLEYDPLVNPRSHKLGAKRKILNLALREQYNQFLQVQAYRADFSANDRLGLVYYLALQDRLDEAMAQVARVDANEVDEQLQLDYMKAWLAMRRLDVDEALALAKPHVEHPVKRWRSRFANLVQTVEQASGAAADVMDDADRQQDLDRLASLEPSLELNIENGVPQFVAHNLKSVELRYYPMDIELLFSRKPFLVQEGQGFAVIKPSETGAAKVKKAGEPQRVKIPKALEGQNMMIEVAAAGLQESSVYFANRLQVRTMDNYGQIEVREEGGGKLLPKTYIKVYARMTDGREIFWKDGYTDLRGRFDYVSLNDRDPNEVDSLSILVLSDSHGALVEEAKPPKQ